MSVRFGILAMLDHRSMYGYDIRRELECELGPEWSVNYGQVYSTLERLVRDGLVVQSDTVSVGDAPDRKLYTVTPAGRDELGEWFLTPASAGETHRDELFAKLMLGRRSGIDVADIMQVQRKGELRRIAELTALKESMDTAADLSEVLRLDLMILRTEAVIRWLEIAESKIARAAGARGRAGGSSKASGPSVHAQRAGGAAGRSE